MHERLEKLRQRRKVLRRQYARMCSAAKQSGLRRVEAQLRYFEAVIIELEELAK